MSDIASSVDTTISPVVSGVSIIVSDVASVAHWTIAIELSPDNSSVDDESITVS